MKQVAIAMCVGLVLTASSAQAIVIDNGIPIGVRGHWSVNVLTGGAIDSVVYTVQRHTTADLLTANVVSRSSVFVDPGIDGGGFELQGSEPERDPFDPIRRITSSGTFIGANGNAINWIATSSVGDGPFSEGVDTTYSFLSTDSLPSFACLLLPPCRCAREQRQQCACCLHVP